MNKLCLALSIFFTSITFADAMPSLEGLEPVQAPAQEVTFESPYRSPYVTVGLSILFPGFGHIYLGDAKTAGAFAGTVAASLGANAAFGTDAAQTNSMVVVQNTWLYGIYSSYRDVRLFNGEKGYRYIMPKDSLRDLSYAPVNWRVMKKAEVWGGILGGLTLAVGSGVLADRYAHIVALDAAGSEDEAKGFDNISPFAALPVGIGEEAFFRGYLQSALSEALSPWGGMALSSLLFTAVHIPNAQFLPEEHRRGYYMFGLPLIASLGSYFSYLTYKNHSLKESVAVHTWYDFTLFSLSVLASRKASVGLPKTFAISIPF